VIPAAGSNSIVCIVLLIAKIEMIRVDAEHVIATMKNA